MSASLTALNDTSSGHGDLLCSRLVGFVRFLHDNGFPVGVREALDTLNVAALCGVTDQQLLGWGLRSLLCSNGDQWGRFNVLFRAYWRPPNRQAFVPCASFGRSEKGRGARQSASATGETADVEGAGIGRGADAGSGASRGGASERASQARMDFRFLHDGRELREMEELTERLAKRMRRRLKRRQRVQQRGRRIHLRRTLRKSLRFGGTPLELAYRSRRRLLPRLVFILDVSRSMSLYSYFFLRFARGIVEAFNDAHAFVLHTNLVNVTHVLRERDMGKLKEKLAALSMGWGGGTRIGECLQSFNRGYARRLVNSRCMVFIVSDGLDTGEPDLLAREMARVRQRARRVLWLNPLLGRDGYEPSAAGMQAALPYLDLFAPAHNLESLHAIESQITKL